MDRRVTLKLPRYAVMLSPQQIFVLMQGLGELPAKHSRDIMDSIENQVAQQNAAAERPVEPVVDEAAGD